MSALFRNLVFAFAGAQWQPEPILRKMILSNQGLIEDTVSDKVTHVLSSDEMATVWGNTYKMQFFPDFEGQVSIASVYHIPIINGKFIQDCIDSGKVITELTPYLIFGGEAKQVDTSSKLDPRVQDVVRLIFDKSAQQQAILEMSLDPSRVVNITQAQITSAYSVLSEIEKAIQLKNIKKSRDEAMRKLGDLSRQFYNLIPHTATPTIDNEASMKEKLTMLEALTDIEIANRMMKDSSKVGRYSVNPIDVNYKKLKTKITPLESYTHEYDIIKNMVSNTRAKIHDYFTIELEDIFEIEREGEADRFSQFKALKHHRLLWHGSRLSNFCGILSQGLRIAPPEAPVTGYFLGKGIYFGDIVTKSVEYCHPTKENPYILMILCDVALGRPFQTAHTKFITKEDLDEAGFHSVKGCGELGPDPAYDCEISDGVIVSLGHEAPTGVPRSEVSHNEYIVYDVSQVNMKYLVKLKVTSDRAVKAASLVAAN